MRPTGAAVLLFGGAIPLTLALVLFDTELWPVALATSFACLVLLGVDAVRTPGPAALRREVTGPEILYIGDADPLRVSLSLAAPRPLEVEMIVDVGALLEPLPPAQVRVEPGPPTDIEMPLVPVRRGTAVVERAWYRWTGPLGLIRRTAVDPMDQEIAVVPNVRAVKSEAIRFSEWSATLGIKPESRVGQGSEFEAMRDYVAGLDHRWIDWKHSARHRMLVCKEFRTERNHQVILAFDTGHLMSEPVDGVSRLDHAINAGLLVGYVSMKSGDQTGLYAFDSDIGMWVEPLGGLQNFGILQARTGRIDYSESETNFTLGLARLAERLSRRSLIILQTDFVDTTTAELMVENIARLTARHLVLFVSIRNPELNELINRRPSDTSDVARAVVATQFQRERQVVFERLRRLGVYCLDVPRERVGVGLINSYLDIIGQELI